MKYGYARVSPGGKSESVELGGLADVERDLIRTRTAEGRSRAKAQGKHMGRPPSLRKKPSGGARKARHSKNSPAATM
jgi:hypothetical protein